MSGITNAALVAAAQVPTEELVDATEAMMSHVGEQLDLLEAKGGVYAREYLKHMLKGSRRPRPPVGMHPKMSHLLRELALDEAAVVRLYGARKKPGTR